MRTLANLKQKRGLQKKEEKKEKGKKNDVGISDIKSRFILAHFHRVSTNEKKERFEQNTYSLI